MQSPFYLSFPRFISLALLATAWTATMSFAQEPTAPEGEAEKAHRTYLQVLRSER